MLVEGRRKSVFWLGLSLLVWLFATVTIGCLALGGY